jgi:ribosome-associated protein
MIPANDHSHARELATAAHDKKAGNIVILDLRGLSNFTDYFVLASGSNPRQNRAIAAEMHVRGKAFGMKKLGEEESDDASWILLDFGDVVAHVLLPDSREYYALEFLWEDAKHVSWG